MMFLMPKSTVGHRGDIVNAPVNCRSEVILLMPKSTVGHRGDTVNAPVNCRS